MPFMAGQGWGEHFAFYMLANDTTMDNITLTGMNIIHPDGSPTRLTDFAWFGVLGTSTLGGRLEDFMVARRAINENDTIREHRYVAGITVQNSIIEKGVILFSAQYALSFERPVTIDNTVLRYSGFTAVFGKAFHWSGTAENEVEGLGFENALAVRRNNVRGEVPTRVINGETVPGIIETDARFLNNRIAFHEDRQDSEYRRFGNFIVLRDVFIYEITTVPIIVDEAESGTFIIFEGDNNKFYTWVRLTDLVFPNFKAPMLPFWDTTPVHGVTRIAQRLIEPIIAAYEHLGPTVRERTTHLMNIPLISLGSGNGQCIAGTNWDLSSYGTADGDTFMIGDIDLQLGGLILDIFFLMPPRAVRVYTAECAEVIAGTAQAGFGHAGFVTLYEQRRILAGEFGGVTRLINEMRVIR